MGSMVWKPNEVDHVDTCFHGEEDYQLVKEAEQVAVFHNTRTDQYHLSVRLGNWFHCQWFEGQWFRRFSDKKLMSYVNKAMADLRQREDPRPDVQE